MFNQEMSRYPIKVTLKDGTDVTLRLMVREDEDKLLKFFRAVPDEDRIFLADDVTNRAVIRRWVRELDYENVLPILAEIDDEIVADVTLKTNRMGWMRHVGEVRCVVALEYRRRGLGTMMVSRLIEHAVLMGLDKIVFRAMETQVGAIRAMENLGFTTEATLRDHVTDLRGRPHDLIIMTNYVAELWRKMEDAILDSEFKVIP
jgi:RimJ/RimL family protein N-acetyltransferase